MNQAWIVDDDKEISAALRMMLKLLNFELRVFNDARHGARALITDPTPDLMFLDLNMPEVTGIDLLDFIRGKSRWSNLPVIIISAETSDATVEQAYQHGADAFLFKPVTVGELKAGIAKAIQKRSTQLKLTP